MKTTLILLAVLLPAITYAQTYYVYPNGDTLSPGIQEPVAPGNAGSGTSYGKDAYLYLPKGYDSTKAARYPLIFFYHGAGEVGSGGSALPKMLRQGLPEVIQQGHPPFSVNASGDTTWFIVYSRQFTYQAAQKAEPATKIDYRKLLDYYHLKVDTNRIYATGLSAGGGSVQDMALRMKWLFAAAVPMSASVQLDTTGSLFGGVPISIDSMRDRHMWLIHSYNDNTAYFSKSTNPAHWINSWFPGHAILTSYSGGHCCWPTFYYPTWKWTASNSTQYDIGPPNNMSIYDWMLQFSLHSLRTSSPTITVNAGPDRTLNAGITSTGIIGSATDEDGIITSYHWTTPSDATITAPDSENTTVTGLQDGTSYAFTLTVTDNKGATATDEVIITVKSPSSGPVLIIDEDTTITDPLTSYTFDSVSVTPTNGNAFSANSATVLWTLVSKPAGTGAFLSGPQYQLTGHSLLNMNENGSYLVTLKVTQSDGTSTTDSTTITRIASTDIPPVANAGPDHTLSPETTSAALVGSATDEDGIITSYHWTTPSDATITAPDSENTTVTGLQDGTSYAFTLTVTDNKGATATDEVILTVKSPSSGPILIIDEDTTITDPLTSYTFDSVSVIPTNGNTFSANSATVLWTLVSKPAGTAAFWSASQYQLNGHSLLNMNENGSYLVTLKVTQSDGTSTTDSTTITRVSPNDLSVTTGSKKGKKFRTEYLIYPNPATTSAITITDKLKNPLGRINIYDLTGKLHQTTTTNESQIVLQLSADAPGIYIVQIIKSDHNKYSQKLIVSPKRPE